jgi:hypothetical protein
MNGLRKNKVMNNGLLEESIVDLVMADIDGDGFTELIVLYFNKRLQIYKIREVESWECIARFELNSLMNLPYCMALIVDSGTPVLYLFATNCYYRYDLDVGGRMSEEVGVEAAQFEEIGMDYLS